MGVVWVESAYAYMRLSPVALMSCSMIQIAHTQKKHSE